MLGSRDIVRHILDGSGQVCIVVFDVRDGTRVFKQQQVFSNVDKALSFADAQNEDGFDVSIGLAQLGEERNRQRDNCIGFKCFALDIDVGRHDYEPQSKREAAKLLLTMVKKENLPYPYIIDSGGGLHVYWLLPDEIPTKEWVAKSKALGVLCGKHDLIVDASKVSDPTIALTMPGSYSHKREREVKLIKQGVVEMPKLQAVKAKPKGKKSSKFDRPPSMPDADFDLIVKGCKQFSDMQENDGDVYEPLRYAAIQVMRHCDIDVPSIVDFFKGRGSVDDTEVSYKLQQLESKDIGPTTCEKFSDENPAGCQGCPFAGKITSPIMLGVKAPEYKEKPVVKGVERPTKIGNFSISEDGVFYKDDEKGPIRILKDPMYLERLGRNHEGGVATIVHRTARNAWRTVELPTMFLAEPREMRRWLSSNLIRYTLNKETLIMQFLGEQSDKSQETAEPDEIISQFGWDDTMDNFTIGLKQYNTDGKVSKARLDSSIGKQLRKLITTKGQLTDWTETTECYNNPDYAPHAFALLCALGSPLLKMINVQGCVVSLVGPSGTGKTTALRHAMSVYGDRYGLLLSGNPTITAQIETLRIANNIPVGMDDLTAQRLKVLKDMVYMAANGQSRERATKDGTLRERHTWATTLLLSSNTPLLQMRDTIADAERRRIIEIDVADEHRISRRDGEFINDTITDNYGVAGDAYIRALMKNRKKVKSLAMRYKTMFWEDSDIPDDHRFGAWMCGAAMAAGLLAYKKGIIAFQPLPVVQHALESLRNAASIEETPIDKMDTLMAQYRNDNYQFMNRIENNRFLNSQMVTKNKVMGVLLVSHGEIAIPVRTIREWLVDQNESLVDFRTWCRARKIVKRRQLVVPTTLGGQQEWCIIIPYNPNEIQE